VAISGGWGTLSEAAFCLKLGVPLVGLCDRLPDALPIERYDDPVAAVARAVEHAQAGREARAE
jgi:predicted Rossmann-fold nucleotide-binding protein